MVSHVCVAHGAGGRNSSRRRIPWCGHSNLNRQGEESFRRRYAWCGQLNLNPYFREAEMASLNYNLETVLILRTSVLSP